MTPDQLAEAQTTLPGTLEAAVGTVSGAAGRTSRSRSAATISCARQTSRPGRRTLEPGFSPSATTARKKFLRRISPLVSASSAPFRLGPPDLAGGQLVAGILSLADFQLDARGLTEVMAAGVSIR